MAPQLHVEPVKVWPIRRASVPLILLLRHQPPYCPEKLAPLPTPRPAALPSSSSSSSSGSFSSPDP
eukprot:2820524-Pyramimonas_sp.AAC.1